MNLSMPAVATAAKSLDKLHEANLRTARSAYRVFDAIVAESG